MYPSPMAEAIPELLVSALEKGDDLILTSETAPDRDRKRSMS